MAASSIEIRGEKPDLKTFGSAVIRLQLRGIKGVDSRGGKLTYEFKEGRDGEEARERIDALAADFTVTVEPLLDRRTIEL